MLVYFQSLLGTSELLIELLIWNKTICTASYYKWTVETIAIDH